MSVEADRLIEWITGERPAWQDIVESRGADFERLVPVGMLLALAAALEREKAHEYLARAEAAEAQRDTLAAENKRLRRKALGRKGFDVVIAFRDERSAENAAVRVRETTGLRASVVARAALAGVAPPEERPLAGDDTA